MAVGNTADEAREFADAFHLWLSHAESSSPFERVPSLETTRAHRWTPDELAVRARNEGRLISGTGAEVVAQLRALAETYGTDEVMINLMMPGEAARFHAIDAITAAMAGAAAPASDKAAVDAGALVRPDNPALLRHR